MTWFLNFSTEFQCKSGKCISDDWVCDSFVDCPDAEDDEMGCERECPEDNSYPCTNSTDACVHHSYICDGYNDCVSGSDEDFCNSSCSPGEFR